MFSGVFRLGNHIITLPAIIAALVCLLAAGSIHALTPAPRLSSDSEIATAGFYRLSWETGAGRVELQEAAGPDFHNPATPYTGPDRAAVISGKPDGTWYYRVRALDHTQAGPWSEPVAVVVKHHSLTRGLIFLSLGITVFVVLVVMIIRGAGKAE